MMPEIQQQIQKVHAAYEAWERSDPAFEDAAWRIYQAEHAKLDAMYAWAKAEAREGVIA